MIRSSLAILDTYKWLIYFPQNSVEHLLKQDDYEQILNGYKQAFVLMSKADVATRKSKLFAQIRSMLDAKILRIQKHILDKLKTFPANPDEQMYLIMNFNSFEIFNLNNSGVSYYSSQFEGVDSNNVGKKLESSDTGLRTRASPAWYVLEEEKKWLIQLMIECRDMHIADEKVNLALKQSKAAEDSSSSNANSGNSGDQSEGGSSHKIQVCECVCVKLD